MKPQQWGNQHTWIFSFWVFGGVVCSFASLEEMCSVG